MSDKHRTRTEQQLNREGDDCPRCGFSTLKAEFDDEVWYRCITDSCPRGWYCAE